MGTDNTEIKKILISGCLIGEKVKYNGLDNQLSSKLIEQWTSEGRLVPICPEVEGGLPVPRNPVEILNGNGSDVLNGVAKAYDDKGNDVTEAFITGAEKALKVAKEQRIDIAVLKERSPSCGSNSIYNGKFNGTKIDGMGVTASLLAMNGVKVFSEDELENVADLLKKN